MAAAGVILPSSSPWAAPAVLMQKKNGEWRFCVDYWRLNAVMCKDAYPLPCIDEVLDHIAESSWSCSLDLRSGYWQVRMAPELNQLSPSGRGCGRCRSDCATPLPRSCG
ncbi:hypothetical protein AAFF_G00192850 [Aldrovandia affinis]|uniref:ribonuclease H n=1 Tax=Aldrovandia affinis TaxID=143900 RepID=A0AAD7RJ29_9TELE|nr:hypothetical protein AAFF_G00192850 [Aldrovandia affinis]